MIRQKNAIRIEIEKLKRSIVITCCHSLLYIYMFHLFYPLQRNLSKKLRTTARIMMTKNRKNVKTKFLSTCCFKGIFINGRRHFKRIAVLSCCYCQYVNSFFLNENLHRVKRKSGQTSTNIENIF